MDEGVAGSGTWWADIGGGTTQLRNGVKRRWAVWEGGPSEHAACKG